MPFESSCAVMMTVKFDVTMTSPAQRQHWLTMTVEPFTTYYHQLECGPMPNLMVALPNIAGALCSTPQSLA